MKFVEFESTYAATENSPGNRVFIDPKRVEYFEAFKHVYANREAVMVFLENSSVVVFGGVDEVAGKLGVDLA